MYRLGLGLTKILGHCILCCQPALRQSYLCAACDSDMQWLPKPFTVADSGVAFLVQAASLYGGIFAQAISRFKDDEDLQTLPLLVRALEKLATALPALLSDNAPAVILPMPTTLGRLRQRGFDPVFTLAMHLSYLTGLPLYDGVIRPHESTHQRGLDRSQRRSNVQDAFVLTHSPECRTVLIFDDVSTTGTTLAQLGKTLLLADESLCVRGLCLAHGNPIFVT